MKRKSYRLNKVHKRTFLKPVTKMLPFSADRPSGFSKASGIKPFIPFPFENHPKMKRSGVYKFGDSG
jgi:hypothetical protein